MWLITIKVLELIKVTILNFFYFFKTIGGKLAHIFFIHMPCCNGISNREKKFWSNQVLVENMFTSILVMRLLRRAASDVNVRIFRINMQPSRILWILFFAPHRYFGVVCSFVIWIRFPCLCAKREDFRKCDKQNDFLGEIRLFPFAVQ